MRYIALLRGVNVGGKNIILSEDLKECFLACGLENVKTYINSGNVLFDAEAQTEDILAGTLSKAIKERHNISTEIALINAQSLIEAIDSAPDWWGASPEEKHNAIFVIKPSTAGEVIAEVGEALPEYEKIYVKNDIIFWTAPLKTYSRTKWSKVSGTNAYKCITIRNANTAHKLKELAQK